MSFKFSGYVTDICQDTFWAETVSEHGSITDELIEIYKWAIPDEEKDFLFEGAWFTFHSDKGIIFSKEIWTKAEIEKAKFIGKEIFKFFYNMEK